MDDATTNSGQATLPEADDIQQFWESLSFFQKPIESFAARRWPVLLCIPVLVFLCFGYYFTRLHDRTLTAGHIASVLQDPYIASLLLALVLSGCAFSLWQKAFRKTFSLACVSGFVSDSPEGRTRFAVLSRKLEADLRSRWRFLVIAFVLALTIWPTESTIVEAMRDFAVAPWISLFFVTGLACFCIFAYAVGAVAWCLYAGSRWIARLSNDACLRIQLGHSDDCCGFEPIGNCCLQSTIPLIIGTLLCLLWTGSNHIAPFRNYRLDWRLVIVPASYVMLASLIILGCALVFLPSLHRRMERARAEQDVLHSAALSSAVSVIATTIMKEAAIPEDVSNRANLAKFLDPVELRLSAWPFNRAPLIKYALTPGISLAASFGKQFLHQFWQ